MRIALGFELRGAVFENCSREGFPPSECFCEVGLWGIAGLPLAMLDRVFGGRELTLGRALVDYFCWRVLWSLAGAKLTYVTLAGCGDVDRGGYGLLR